MTAIKMCFKSVCLTLVLAVLSSTAHAASFLEGAGDFYHKITNPVSLMVGKELKSGYVTKQVQIDPRVQGIKNKSKRLNYYVNVDFYTSYMNFDDYRSSHANGMLSMMTMGNDESQRNLNIAYRLSRHINQYHLFVYNGKDWAFLPVHMDAASMLLYGFSYLLNTPQRTLSKVNLIWNAGEKEYSRLTVGNKIAFMIDVVISLLSQVVEIFLALVGTVIGFVVAFICHPINSLCSIGGMFYFLLPVLWSAIAGSIVALFGIFI